MTEVEIWTVGKPYLIRLFAPRLAADAQELHKAFEQIKERRILNHKLPTPDLPTWFTLYRSHRKTFEVLRKIFAIAYGERISKYGYWFFRLLISFRTVKKIARTTQRRQISQRQIDIIVKAVNSLLPISFKILRLDLSGAPIDPAKKAAIIDQISNNLETSFFILVTAPCWLLYQISPAHLYRKARRGDEKAIDKLLRLDAFMLHDPSIFKHITKLHLNNKSVLFQDLLAAPFNAPIVLISRKQIKASIAGLISAISHLINHPLTEPQIRDLFDAVAKDSVPSDAKLETIDTDLPEGQQAFSKAIQRSRYGWERMFKPDK